MTTAIIKNIAQQVLRDFAVFHNIERTIEEQIITRFSFKKQRKLRGQYFHPLRAKTKKKLFLIR